MAQTLQNILDDVASFIDQDTTLATGTELTIRVNFVNQALKEWSNAYQWKSLRVTHSPSFSLSAISLGLPTNFKKLMSPVYDMSKTTENEYPEIRAWERFTKVSTDRYVYQSGDDASGYYLTINPALVSGASIVLDYQSHASSMATLADICVCPQPQFVSRKVIGYILESRSDARFPQINAEADRLLLNMIEEENAASGGENNRTPDIFRQIKFRVGSD